MSTFRNTIRTTLLFVIVILFFGPKANAIQPLKDYNFNSGDYYVVGTVLRRDRTDSIQYYQYQLDDFYTKDTSLLNELNKEWDFEREGGQFACGYHFKISICKNGLSVQDFWINLNCHVINYGRTYRYFESEKLNLLFEKVDWVKSKKYRFGDLDSARTFRATALRDSVNLLLMPTPDWVRYEGWFDFEYNCPDSTRFCMEKEDSLIKMFHKQIALTYPNEEFELRWRGGSLTSILQTVNCNKSLSDKFDLYIRNKDSYFGKWNPYDLSFTCYWIEENKDQHYRRYKYKYYKP